MAPEISDQNHFLSQLSPTDLSVLRPHLVDCDITTGDCLHRVGDSVETVIFPHSAVIGMTLPLRDAASAVAGWVGREGVVGGLSASVSTPATCNADACIGGRASLISAAAFRHALDHHPGIARLAARYDAAMMTQMQQNAVAMLPTWWNPAFAGACSNYMTAVVTIKSHLNRTRSRNFWQSAGRL
jgi:hypothetical protein